MNWSSMEISRRKTSPSPLSQASVTGVSGVSRSPLSKRIYIGVYCLFIVVGSVLVSFHEVHVSHDGDSSAGNRGELELRFGVDGELVPFEDLFVALSTGAEFLVLEMGARGIGHLAPLCKVAPPRVSRECGSSVGTERISMRV